MCSAISHSEVYTENAAVSYALCLRVARADPRFQIISRYLTRHGDAQVQAYTTIERPLPERLGQKLALTALFSPIPVRVESCFARIRS